MDLIAPEKILETSRLQLEPLTSSHASLIYEQLQDERLYKFIPQNSPRSLQALETRYLTLSSRLSPNGQEVWLNWVMRLCDIVYIGLLEATVYTNHTAELAYMIFPPFWQKGYAKEGCERVLEHLFKDYGVNQVTVNIDTRNIASIRLVEALGFEYVSTQADVDFFKGSTSHEYQYKRVSPLT